MQSSAALPRRVHPHIAFLPFLVPSPSPKRPADTSTAILEEVAGVRVIHKACRQHFPLLSALQCQLLTLVVFGRTMHAPVIVQLADGAEQAISTLRAQ